MMILQKVYLKLNVVVKKHIFNSLLKYSMHAFMHGARVTVFFLLCASLHAQHFDA